MAARSEPQLRQLVEEVDSGLCVDIEGLPGSGRSTLLDALGGELRERGRQVVRIDGIRALRDRPLGVISVLERAGPQPSVTSVPDAARRLVKLLGSARSVLMIDDVEDLDGLSSGVAHVAHAELRMPVVVTRRPGTDRREAVRNLLPALQPGVSVRLGPLPFAEVHELLHEALPDTIDPALVARIAVMAGGLPGLAKAFATAARMDRRIVREQGVWRAVSDLWTPSLGHALAPLLRDLEQEDVDALALLSLAASPTVRRAQRLVGMDRLHRLERSGVVAVTQEPDGQIVTVVPPALGEHLAREAGPLRRQTLRDFVDDDGKTPDTLAAPEPASRDLEDSVAAKRLLDHWEARHRVLRKRWMEDPTAARAVPLVISSLVRGESPERVVRLTRPGTDIDDARLQGWFTTYLGGPHGDLAAARRHAAALHTQPARALAHATVRYLDLVFDHVPTLDELAPTVEGGSELEDVTLRQVRIEREVAVGNVRTARSLAEAFEPGYPLIIGHRGIALSLARILDGDVRAETDAAITAMKEAMHRMAPGSVQGYAYAAALGLTLGGRLAELDALVASALTVTTRTPAEEHYRAGVVAVAAIAAYWQGRRQFARRLAFQARALDDRAGPFPGMLPGHLSELSEGGPESARRLWRLAEERLSRGYVAAGAFCGVVAVESHPDEQWAARIWSAAGTSESAVLRAIAQYAVALGADDLDALAEARSALGALGLRTYQARALIQEAMGWRRRGLHDRALRSVESAWDLTSTFGGPQRGFFEPFVDDLALTPRELEVIEMLVGGLSTNEVASQLSISPRTVENQVYNCYRKTGIGGREGLHRAASTWLDTSAGGTR